MENGNLPSSTDSDSRPKTLYAGDEGDEGIGQGTTLTFAMMELCLCVMVRQVGKSSMPPVRISCPNRLLGSFRVIGGPCNGKRCHQSAFSE